jgi:hypothetical protein
LALGESDQELTYQVGRASRAPSGYEAHYGKLREMYRQYKAYADFVTAPHEGKDGYWIRTTCYASGKACEEYMKDLEVLFGMDVRLDE